jgi:hypothetical protein
MSDVAASIALVSVVARGDVVAGFDAGSGPASRALQSLIRLDEDHRT